MKQFIRLVSLLVMGLAVGCSEVYDDSDLRDEIESLKEKIEEVETLLNASANNLTITSVEENEEGFVVTFSDGSTISVKHGADGKDGADGEDGKDGANGEDGKDGANGKDGKDGQDGKDGETLIESINIGESDVTFILTSGKTVIIPLEGYYDSSEAPINFLDNTTKVLCVLAWDSDGDQQLSYKEAAAVTDIGTTFKNTEIMAFRELRFFTALTEIKDYAFYGCERLIAITLPETIRTIGTEAFRNCSSLQEITIPNGTTTLGDGLFQNCISLKTATIPASVEEIPYYCFYLCEQLSDIVIEEGVGVIGERAFQSCYGLKAIEIPQSVTQIGRNVFYFCEALESVVLPEGLARIENESFYNCESLRSIILPSALTSIGNYAFRNCLVLDKVVVNEGLQEIGSYAFKNCPSLTEITIPKSVTTIGGWTFEDCTSLVTVCCEPVEPPTLGTDAFDNNGSGRLIYVPEGSVESYRLAEKWSNYAQSIVAQSVE